jgi:serine/threonine protein phosphatase PrpC
MKAAVVSEIGGRSEMEDAYFLDINFADRGWLFGGVYDGHAGAFAAVYAAERLHGLFLERLMAGLSPQDGFIESYERISEELKTQDSGTTAVTFLIQDARLFTANVGDTRALVVSRKDSRQLTIDHRLDNREERARIVSRGGRIAYPYVYRGYRGLMPTRAIGDPYFEPVGVIATPSVGEYDISTADLFLIAACDGLFDVMTNDEVSRIARDYPGQPETLLEALKHQALVARDGQDNLTIIAVSLGPTEAVGKCLDARHPSLFKPLGANPEE